MPDIEGLADLHGWTRPHCFRFNGLVCDDVTGNVRFGKGTTAIYCKFRLDDGWHDVAITHCRWSLVKLATVQADEDFLHGVRVQAGYGQDGLHEAFVHYIIQGQMFGLDGDSVLDIKFVGTVDDPSYNHLMP